MCTKTMRLSVQRQANLLPRWLRLSLPVPVAVSALFVPLVIIPSNHQSTALLLIQGLVCGIVLGIGRQGIDVLAIRLYTASLALLIGALIPFPWSAGLRGCSGLRCAGSAVAICVFVAAIFALALALVALPTALLWNRGLASMKPELGLWGPRSDRERLIIVLGAMVAFIALWLLAGIPANT